MEENKEKGFFSLFNKYTLCTPKIRHCVFVVHVCYTFPQNKSKQRDQKCQAEELKHKIKMNEKITTWNGKFVT